MPARSPPALPPGVTPVMVVLVSAVTRPSVSMLTTGTVVAVPMGPIAAPCRSASSGAPIVPTFTCMFIAPRLPDVVMSDEPSATGSMMCGALIFNVVAPLFTAVTTLSPAVALIVGLGYVPARSPPAAPTGGAPVMAVVDRFCTRPSPSTVITGINVPEPWGVVGRPAISASSAAPTTPLLSCMFMLRRLPVVETSLADNASGSTMREAAILEATPVWLMAVMIRSPVAADVEISGLG